MGSSTEKTPRKVRKKTQKNAAEIRQRRYNKQSATEKPG